MAYLWLQLHSLCGPTYTQTSPSTNVCVCPDRFFLVFLYTFQCQRRGTLKPQHALTIVCFRLWVNRLCSSRLNMAMPLCTKQAPFGNGFPTLVWKNRTSFNRYCVWTGANPCSHRVLKPETRRMGSHLQQHINAHGVECGCSDGCNWCPVYSLSQDLKNFSKISPSFFFV